MNQDNGEDILQPDIAISSRRARHKRAVPPLVLLVLVLMLSGILRLTLGPAYIVPMPLILVIMGVGVAYYGAFSDFGAKRYFNDMTKNRVKITDEDITYINRQQFLLTLLFLGVAGLYVAGAVFVYFLT